MSEGLRVALVIITLIVTPGNMYFALYAMHKEKHLQSFTYCVVTVLGMVAIVGLAHG